MPIKTGDTQKLSELRIVLMGYKGAGKSSSGNIILNTEEFDLKRTAQCVKRQREVADRHITVIEAPGWWIHEPVDQSSELLKQEILLSVSLCPPGPHVVLLVIRVDIRFKEFYRKVFQGYVDLLGERVWSHTIVLFTHGDFLGDTSIEQHIEREGEDLQWLVEKCGNRYHVLNNKNRSDDTQIKDLLEKIEETVTQNKICLEQRWKAEKDTPKKQTRTKRHTTAGVFCRREPVAEKLRYKSLISPPTMSNKISTTPHLFIPAGQFSLYRSISSMSSGYGSLSSIPGSVENLGPSIKMNVSSSSEHPEQVQLKD